MKCSNCNGTGEEDVLQNPECHFDGLETPIYEKDVCSACDGSGEEPDETYCEECGSSNVDVSQSEIVCKHCGHIEHTCSED